MSKVENQLKESTSHIANVSYDIENMISKGKNEEEIKDYIERLKKKGDENGIKFPENLEYVGSYFDKEFSSSGCAFLDKNTGEVTVGFAGTNNENDYFWGDAKADGAIAIGGISKDSNYMKKPNAFIEGLRDKGYNITTVTGHSL